VQFTATYSDPSLATGTSHPVVRWDWTGASLGSHFDGSTLTVITSSSADAGEPVSGDHITVLCSDGSSVLSSAVFTIVNPSPTPEPVGVVTVGAGGADALGTAQSVQLAVGLSGGLLAFLVVAALMVKAFGR
jgi:hypothetical protein